MGLATSYTDAIIVKTLRLQCFLLRTEITNTIKFIAFSQLHNHNKKLAGKHTAMH